MNRISEIVDSIPGLNLHVIRFNPHHSSWRRNEEWQGPLLLKLQNAIRNNRGGMQTNGCFIEYLGYPSDRIRELEEAAQQAEEELLEFYNNNKITKVQVDDHARDRCARCNSNSSSSSAPDGFCSIECAKLGKRA